MASTYVLFFDGSEMTALRAHGGRVESLERFAATPVGMEALVTLLRARSKKPVLVLADIAEEGFQLENIPRLQSSDRKAMINRRLGQYFYGTPYATSLSLGHESGGRRDERVQFAALTRPNMLMPWFDALREARIPVLGLFSVPLVLGKQTLGFAAGEKRFVVVTTSAGGLRQTFFDNGQMHFSRLTQLPNLQAETIASTCSKETAKTVQYLLGQRQITRGAALPVFVLAHSSHHAIFAAHCTNIGDIDYRLIDMQTFAGSVGYTGTVTDSFVESILVHCLASRPPPEQFAPDTERKVFRLWQLRRGMRAAAFLLASTALIASTKIFIDAALLKSDSSDMRAATLVDQRRYEALLSGLPLVSVSADNLRAVLVAYDEIERRSPAIKPALMHLGASLAEFPGIDLKRIEWKADAGSDSPNPRAAPGTTPAVAKTMLEVEGTLPLALAGDQRRQIELMEKLASHLQRDGARVTVVTMPVEVQLEKALRSDERAGGTGAPVKNFVVQIVLPPPGMAVAAPGVKP
ncbi:MAG: hypothetical protein IPG34_00110 [Rhodocyclaceae bacterium]|nr:hypothetical protein [Rhodocyclaceae bacterium]